MVFFTAALKASPAHADEALWQRLATGGHAVILRHAVTEPGIGDPPGFRLGDCATQRNLSPAGRDQSRRIGAAFAQRGVRVERVLAGEWCRTRDTAQLAFGRYAIDTALNSFFDDRSRADAQVARMRQLVANATADGALVLVTHQVNVTALTGEVPAMGEAVVVKATPDGRIETVGRLRAGQ